MAEGVRKRFIYEGSREDRKRMPMDMYREFKAFAESGMQQYGLSPLDLTTQMPVRLSKEELVYVRAGVQRRNPDPIDFNRKSRKQIQRFVENALSRPTTTQTARRVIRAIDRCKKTFDWRKKNGDFRNDFWSQKFFAMHKALVPYVFVLHQDAQKEAPLTAFIHPKAVNVFVEQCLNDASAWISPEQRAGLKNAIIKSIQARAKDRSRAMWAWLGQSEMFIDVRIYEGPSKDRESGTIVGTKEIRYRRVKPFSNETEPLGPREREPRACERLRAIMSDAFEDTGKPTALVDFTRTL